jgi:hypothetical protein
MSGLSVKVGPHAEKAEALRGLWLVADDVKTTRRVLRRST